RPHTFSNTIECESDERSECYVYSNRVHGTGYPGTGLYHYDNRWDRRYCTLCDSLSDSPARMRICRRLPCTREQHWPTGTLRYHCCDLYRRRRGNSNTTLQQTNQSPMIIRKTIVELFLSFSKRLRLRRG